jgi:hypothetical protein
MLDLQADLGSSLSGAHLGALGWRGQAGSTQLHLVGATMAVAWFFEGKLCVNALSLASGWNSSLLHQNIPCKNNNNERRGFPGREGISGVQSFTVSSCCPF